MRRVVIAAAFVTSLGACTYLYGLDDFEGDGDKGADGGDASSSDGSSGSSDGSTGGNVGAGDAGSPDAGSVTACENGVVAHWPMDEGSGTQVRDRCTARLDGVLGGEDGGATWGKRGASSCIEVAGNGFVYIGTHAELAFTGSFTVAGFFRSNSTPDGYASLYWNFYGDQKLGIEVTLSFGGDLYAQVGIGSSNVYAGFQAPANGVWTHLAVVVVPNDRVETYANGKLVGATPTTGKMVPFAGETRFGSTYGSKWTGAIDDVIVYSRALSVSEIAELAQR